MNTMHHHITKLKPNCLVYMQHLQNIKRSIFAFLLCIPTSLLALILFLLLIYNGFTVFYFHLPFPSNPLPEPANFSQGNLAKNSFKKLPASVMYAVKEDTPPVILKTLLPLLQNPAITMIPINHSVVFKPNKTHGYEAVKRMLRSADNLKRFSTRVREFFGNHGCKDTHAEKWFKGLKKGNVSPGEVSLGQNMSNLLRLALLYKFGGIYMDTDVIVLKRFTKLRNVIGAQTIDLETRNWSRLNNAVLIFDKKHPLLFKFIEEFALTFDGNKWGHNGPYLVSRVVSRVNGRPGFNFTVLPPPAFYPVDWSRIRSFFRGPRDKVHSTWLHEKLEQIKSESFAVHLWNKQSREIKVESGSIINYIMLDCCVFCNSSSSSL
uniref:Alpha 1,4-glycosyltransferase domain-containing protein n=1 Tax=Populus trichocarpa TaxID=3694 RepID=A0A3N7GJ94_POPTR